MRLADVVRFEVFGQRGRQVSRVGGGAVNGLHRLVQVGRCAVGEEGNHDLARQVIRFEEGADHHRGLVPPAGRTDEQRVVGGDGFRVGQVGDFGPQAVVRLVLDAVAVIVGILGIRVGGFDAEDVRTQQFRNPLGHRLRMSLGGEVGYERPCFAGANWVGGLFCFRCGRIVVGTRSHYGHGKTQKRENKKLFHCINVFEMLFCMQR